MTGLRQSQLTLLAITSAHSSEEAFQNATNGPLPNITVQFHLEVYHSQHRNHSTSME